MSDPLRIAFVGCGRIAGPYADCARKYPDELQIAGAYDLDTERAKALVEPDGATIYGSLDDVLADPKIEAVVNLTIHNAHAEVTRACLNAGKHVHSEKPLAGNRADAQELVALAKSKGLLLGCSPFVALGEAQQTLWKAVRDGIVGEVLEVAMHIMHGRIERKNPNPEPFLGPGAGPLLDVGCYPLNVVTTIFGPIARILGATAKTLVPHRVIGSGPYEGKEFDVPVSDHVNALFEFASGIVGRLTASFTLSASTLPGIEIYGTEGTLTMAVPFLFNSPVRFKPAYEGEWEPVPFLADPFGGVDWARGLADLARAVRTGSQLHATGELAAHILDASLGILEAAEAGHTVDVTSRFTAPAPVLGV